VTGTAVIHNQVDKCQLILHSSTAYAAPSWEQAPSNDVVPWSPNSYTVVLRGVADMSCQYNGDLMESENLTASIFSLYTPNVRISFDPCRWGGFRAKLIHNEWVMSRAWLLTSLANTYQRMLQHENVIVGSYNTK
jgi:hypothetical protein